MLAAARLRSGHRIAAPRGVRRRGELAARANILGHVKRVIDFVRASAGAAVALASLIGLTAGAVSFNPDDLLQPAQAATRAMLLGAAVYFLGGWLYAFVRGNRGNGGRLAAVCIVAFFVGMAWLLTGPIRDLAGDRLVIDWVGRGQLRLTVAVLGAVWVAFILVSVPAGAWRNRRRPCPDCREKIRPNALKCPRCHSLLPPERTGGCTVACPDCGEMIRSSAKVCRYCGYRHDTGIAIGRIASLRQPARTFSSHPIPFRNDAIRRLHDGDAVHETTTSRE